MSENTELVLDETIDLTEDLERIKVISQNMTETANACLENKDYKNAAIMTALSIATKFAYATIKNTVR